MPLVFFVGLLVRDKVCAIGFTDVFVCYVCLRHKEFWENSNQINESNGAEIALALICNDSELH